MSLTPETLEGVLVVSPQEVLKILSEGGMLIAAFTHMMVCCPNKPLSFE